MKIRYSATINTPGYLPEGEPAVFDTAAGAWAYLRDERQRHEDDTAGTGFEAYSETYYLLCRRARDLGNEPSSANALDTVYGETPGTDSPHDLGLAYSVDAVEEDEPESGYVPCACRDCFDLAISSDVRIRVLCLLCKDADCDPDGAAECQRGDAYDG